VSTQPDAPTPVNLLPDLLAACREIARMKHPSIEHLLRHRGFGFEADRIADLVLAIEALDALDAHRDAD
jgi:hypothetical protein